MNSLAGQKELMFSYPAVCTASTPSRARFSRDRIILFLPPDLNLYDFGVYKVSQILISESHAHLTKKTENVITIPFLLVKELWNSHSKKIP